MLSQSVAIHAVGSLHGIAVGVLGPRGRRASFPAPIRAEQGDHAVVLQLEVRALTAGDCVSVVAGPLCRGDCCSDLQRAITLGKRRGGAVIVVVLGDAAKIGGLRFARRIRVGQADRSFGSSRVLAVQHDSR